MWSLPDFVNTYAVPLAQNPGDACGLSFAILDLLGRLGTTHYTPLGVLRPPKRFLNFVAYRHLDMHFRFWMSRFWLSRFCLYRYWLSRFRLSRFRLCHTYISGSNHGHGTSAWRLVTVEIVTVEIVTDFDCPGFDCPDFVCTDFDCPGFVGTPFNTIS